MHRKRMLENNPMKIPEVAKRKGLTQRGMKHSKESKLKMAKGHRTYFQSKRENLKYSFLYILESKSSNKIKIGVTNNLERRLNTIKKESTIEFELNHFIERKIKDCYKIESELHKKYDNYWKPELSGGGKTEWFDSSILPQVLKDLEQYS